MKDVNILKNAGFEVDEVLQSFGDMEMYDEILTDFYNQTLQRIPKLIEYKEAKDFENYTIIVHTMKTECLYLGIRVLADKCYKHQLMSEANDIEYINNNFDDLMKETAKALDIVKKYFEI